MESTNNTPSPESTPSESTESVDTSVEEGQPEAVAAPVEPVKETPKAKAIRKLQLKVDGLDLSEELPFDLPDDPVAREYMVKQLQMARLGSKRAQEYSQLEKEVRTLIEGAKGNPRKLLKDLSIDAKKLAAEIIEEEISNANKTPEQLEQEKLKEELKALKEEREREKESFQKKEFERVQEQAYEKYDNMITSALDKSDLPKEPYVVKKLADYMLLGLKAGYDVTPDDCISLVQEEIKADIQKMISAMPDEVLEQYIGKDVFSRVRKKNLAKVKEAASVTGGKKLTETGTSAPKTNTGAKKQTIKDFFGV